MHTDMLLNALLENEEPVRPLLLEYPRGRAAWYSKRRFHAGAKPGLDEIEKILIAPAMQEEGLPSAGQPFQLFRVPRPRLFR
jgi:hypothetical protein